MKYQVAELEGVLLDAAVAKAGGSSPMITALGGLHGDCVVLREGGGAFRPSTHWGHGGPIIDREVHTLRREHEEAWYAECKSFGRVGETALIAAMRAYIASKLGEEVELP